jgi:hypothetical protein
MQIDFDKFLIELLNGNPNRRDRALAFYQLLVLASLEVIHVDQDVPMGAIIITKGTKYTVRWRSDTADLRWSSPCLRADIGFSSSVSPAPRRCLAPRLHRASKPSRLGARWPHITTNSLRMHCDSTQLLRKKPLRNSCAC